MLLQTVISLSMLVTIIRLMHHLELSENTFPIVFLSVCFFGQLAALTGMACAVPHLIKVGHVIFTLAMWVGAIFLNVHSLETLLILALLGFTLGTRWVYQHCLFAVARGSDATNDPMYDLLYVIPLAIIVSRW